MPQITSRTLRVLQLFSPSQAIWSVEQVAGAIDVSSSSAYRYVQDLLAAGFLYRLDGGGYALGPGIIELDYLIRRRDPLIMAAAPIMRALLQETTQAGAVILCRRFRDRVMCIHQESGSLPHRPAGYERGVTLPMFRGATSRAILAHELGRLQRRIYEDNSQEIAERHGAADWHTFAREHATIRRQRYAEQQSVVTPGVRGTAAAVFQATKVVAAITLVTDAEDEPGSAILQQRRERVIAAAKRITGLLTIGHEERLSRGGPPAPLEQEDREHHDQDQAGENAELDHRGAKD